MNITTKRTKIIATLGPATENIDMVRNLIRAGVNVFRLNFSHKTGPEADKSLAIIRQARSELACPIAIMADIKGPALRLYGYKTPIEISKDAVIIIESKPTEGIENNESPSPLHVFTNLPDIGDLCNIGQHIILMDGYFTGTVVETNRNSISVKIGNAGMLRAKAHLTIPGVDYPIPFLSDKDIADISWAVSNELDYIALSFVRCGNDVEEVRRLILRIRTGSGRKPATKIIAKIESTHGLQAIDEILKEADGIMIARGDMGVEMPLETVPIAQKNLIKKAYSAAKPVITATQMLESMIENPMPTRAEASDVANACFDATSAVMLSGETAIGKYPEQVVNTMHSIIEEVENHFDYENFHKAVPPEIRAGDIPVIMSYNAVSVAYQCNAKAILVLTETGRAARLISRLRPRMPIFAMMSDEHVYHQMALNWGVVPFLHSGTATRLDTVVEEAVAICKKANMLAKGDRIVIVAGLPLSHKGTTNMIRVEIVT